jgi:hypothetical protein
MLAIVMFIHNLCSRARPEAENVLKYSYNVKNEQKLNKTNASIAPPVEIFLDFIIQVT